MICKSVRAIAESVVGLKSGVYMWNKSKRTLAETMGGK